MKRLLYIAFAFIAFSCQPEPYSGPLDSPVGNWSGYKGEYFFNGEMVAELDSCEFKGISFYKQGYCCMEGAKGAFPYIYNESTGDLQIDSTLWHVPTLTGAEMILEFVDRIYPPEPEPVPEPEPTLDDQEQSEEADEPESGEGTEGSEGADNSEGSEDEENPENGEGTEDSEGSEEEEETDPDAPEVPEIKPDKNGVILPAEYKGFTIEANKNGYFYMNASGQKVYCNFKGWKNEADSLIIDFWFDSSTNYLVPMVVEAAKK